MNRRPPPPPRDEPGDDASRETDRRFRDVYDVLRRLAGRFMAHEPKDHTLQPTALVSEAYLRMQDKDRRYETEEEFVAYASSVMRSVLVDHFRTRCRLKRTPDAQRAAPPARDPEAVRAQRILDVDEALTVLEGRGPLSARAAKVIELRYFFGLDEREIAETLGLTTRTVERDAKFARAWLREQLGGA